MTCYKPRFIWENTVKKLLIAAAVLALTPLSAYAADAGGTWKIAANFMDVVKFSETCVLTQTGSALAGDCKDDQGTDVKATGTNDGTNVVISYDTTYQGSPVHLDYKGTFQSDGSLKGEIDTAQANGTFTATKS